MSALIDTYAWTWRFMFAAWQGDEKARAQAVEKVDQNFQRIPLAPNLMLNVIVHCLAIVLLNRATNYSLEFQRFTIYRMLLPCLIGNIMYYYYRFGPKIWNISLTNIGLWVNNWMAMTGVGLVAATKTAAVYYVGLKVEPFLPDVLQGYISFSVQEEERGLRAYVYFFWTLFCALLVTLPLWKRGYELSMKFGAKDGSTISYQELFMDLVYQTSGASSVGYLQAIFLAVLEVNFGLHIHMVHLLLAAVEGLAANVTFQYNFNLFHELIHRVPALYNMSHIEHHICKSIHPANSAVAFWEIWAHGGGVNFCMVFQSKIPFMLIQLAYCGLSFIPHIMSPWAGLAQWHTLHHTVHADIYAGSVPSSVDKQSSRFFAKHHERLEKASIMFRNKDLPDLTALVLIFFFGLIFHYGFGTGLGYLDFASAIHKI